MSNNKQPVELTDITVVSLLAATQGLTMEDRDASTSTPIIDETTGFLLDCAKRGQNRGKQRPSVCKVSRVLRDHSDSSFTPQLVSIGPIHREDPKLQELEWLKECYLDDLLNRSDSTPKETLEACLLKVNTLIPQIRESYADMIKNYSDVELAKMMVMDGCFILEFCFKHTKENVYLPNKMQNTRIAMDLILLENQIPFFVLQALFDCSMGKGPFTLSDVLDKYLAPYVYKLFRPLLPEKKSILSNILDKYLAPYIKLFRPLLPEKNSSTDVDSETPAHVLGYLHKRYNHVAAKSRNPVDAEAFHGQTIVELNRSGMNLKPHQEDVWSMTIELRLSRFACFPRSWSKATLLMPTLVIDDTTELILRNFIAYEQLFPTQGHYYFTSYAVAMDILINTQEDIAKLVESRVLINRLGSNQEAADMINKICKNISDTEFYYTQEFKEMDRYYTNIIAQMKRLYFGDPWSFIKIILFYLTVVQTFFTIKAALDGSKK